MPITADRFHDLLCEHEAALQRARSAARIIIEQIIDNQYDYTDAGAKLAEIRRTLSLLDNLPDKFAIIERRHYNAHARRNRRTKEKMRLKRRQLGIPERAPPGSPQQLEREYIARQQQLQQDADYAAFLQGANAPPANVERASGFNYSAAREQSIEQLDPFRPKNDAASAADAAASENERVDELCTQFFVQQRKATTEQFIAFCAANSLSLDVDGQLASLVASGIIERRDDGTYAILNYGVPTTGEGEPIVAL